MKKPDDLNLDRLLASAQQTGHSSLSSHSNEAERMPERLRTRVLASWRSMLDEQTQAKLQAASLVLMFRRALCCAAVLMLASVAVCLFFDPDDDDVMDIAASALNDTGPADNLSSGPIDGLGAPPDAVP